MGQEFQLPAAFANKQMSTAFQAALGGQQDSLAEGIGQSYAVLGYKGKTWSLRHRGQRHDILRPDDGTPSTYLDVIILQQARHKSKSYYKKYEPGSSDGERPICASMDGIVPDVDVTQKQCESCALCPKNVWKTDPQTGRKGRECTDYKRLAVLILPTQTTPILGSPLMEPVFLRVPPASLNSLAIMGETMDQKGYHYSSYITRITFDPAKAWPEMIFRPLQGLSDAEAPVILKLRDDPLAGRITGGDVATAGLTAVRNALAAPNAATATGLVPSPGEKPETPKLTLVSSLPATAAAPPATPTTAQPTGLMTEASPSPAPSSSNGLVDTGFGGATNATTAASTGEPLKTAASPSVADAGEPEESDAALDARIAALIGAK